jgi:hypothetical protein
VTLRAVSVGGIGLICPAGIGDEGASGGRPGEVPDFRPRAYVDNRKNLKLMSRAVRLGVSAVRLALSDTEGWEEIPPGRRGMFVGSTPGGGELGDLLPALEIAADERGGLDLARFGRDGYRLIHPLWLVKGLSNNVLGFASATHDLQGTNANYCDNDHSGVLAITEGWWAVAEGRAELVVAGAADSWVAFAEALAGRDPGEGAAFLVLRAARPGDRWVAELAAAGDLAPPDEERDLGYLGAAAGPVGLARALLRGEPAALTPPGGRGVRFRPV